MSEGPSIGNSQWVDPFLGSGAADLPKPEGVATRWWRPKPPVGNTHPGATLPFGMVSACAYSGAYVTGYGQYGVSLTGDPPEVVFPRHEALGIAHFQQSGTGRIRNYYNYLLTTPLVGKDLEGLGVPAQLENEWAEPGVYGGRFVETGIDFEVTCRMRVACHRYRFPDGVAGKVAIDFTNGGLRIEGMETFPQKASVELLEDGRCQGMIQMEGVPIHFTIEWTTPLRSCVLWEDGELLPDVESRTLSKAKRNRGVGFGVVAESADNGGIMELRIAFSLQSFARSVEGLGKASRLGFDDVRYRARRHWDSVLGKIQVTGGSDRDREVFYTALYHSAIKPADFRDENPFSKEPGPFFFDLSTLWDLYKTQLPLVMTLWPDWGKNFVEFLSEVGRREGTFPISYLMDNTPERFTKQATGLCHMILADAQMRGIEGDWDEILKLLWETSRHGTASMGKFREFAKHHIVHPLSHTLDLAFANFCIAQMAKRQGDQVIYENSIPLAYHWRNGYDESTGLLRENSDYYEGENWNYSFRFHHDMVGRIKLAGGEEAYVELLDQFFGFAEPRNGGRVFRFEGLNNEPDMEAPYTYLFAGRHDRTAEVVRTAMRCQFSTGRGGLPGNDDSGALSSWFVWSAIGLFPVTGLPMMLIGSPLFEGATLKLHGGNFTISTINQAPDHFHVQRAWLNGRPLDRCFLKLREFQPEAELILEMGPRPSGWGSGERPPSFIS